MPLTLTRTLTLTLNLTLTLTLTLALVLALALALALALTLTLTLTLTYVPRELLVAAHAIAQAEEVAFLAHLLDDVWQVDRRHVCLLGGSPLLQQLRSFRQDDVLSEARRTRVSSRTRPAWDPACASGVGSPRWQTDLTMHRRHHNPGPNPSPNPRWHTFASWISS